ncbi:hypothetical protein THIX_50071 [Thiomonas sp. X19]|nr:hypothetical protein THIX_50071 [Thiomonas sp. X19]
MSTMAQRRLTPDFGTALQCHHRQPNGVRACLNRTNPMGVAPCSPVGSRPSWPRPVAWVL